MKTLRRLLLIALAAVVIPACGDDGDQGGAGEDTDSENWNIEYVAVYQDNWGSNPVYGIRYNDNAAEDVWVGTCPASPWSHAFPTDDPDFPVSIWAQTCACVDCDGYTATVEVFLYIDQRLYATATDSAQDGPAAEAEISGTLSSFLNSGPIDD
jgi:hypothetical protein